MHVLVCMERGRDAFKDEDVESIISSESEAHVEQVHVQLMNESMCVCIYVYFKCSLLWCDS